MEQCTVYNKNANNLTHNSTISEYFVGKTKYKVTSYFVGDRDVKTSILSLAEKKAIKKMGLD